MIGMLRKELLNLGTVRVDLALEHAQHSHPRQSQATLGANKRLAGHELGGTRKDFHPLLIGLRTRQLLSVEELLHLRLPADTKACGVGKASTKAHALGSAQSSKASRAAG